MKQLIVNTKSSSYDILIEKGILSRCAEYIAQVIRGKKAMIITDSNVAPLYLDTVSKSLTEYGFDVYSHIFTAGEKSKHLGTISDIYDSLSEHDFTRKDFIVALGGGVVGDIAGFAAATYMRSIDFVQIPTTLLSQVDSSVGGKTGVDTKYGKNLVGAFYQPKLVVIDPLTLDTLSDHFFADGMGEVIKYGCIKNSELFSILEKVDVKENIEDIILECLKIKRDVVNEDERESGIRMILNFGHTLGHSIEKMSEFSLSHGECVAKGMVLITKASENAGITKKGTAEKIEKLCKKHHLDTSITKSTKDIAQNAKNDKKGSGDKLNIVLLSDIGHYLIHTIEKDEFAQFLS
ncbi:MAG: 3-dehydroquinate synthase [Ruminococcaceae bacterium]|nr:3-dehydroquinate synthase [Oscillospiraceae bacterium]